MVWQLVNGGFINLPIDFFENYHELKAERESESAKLLQKRIDTIKVAKAEYVGKKQWYELYDEPTTPKIIEDAQLIKDYVRANPREPIIPEHRQSKFEKYANKHRAALVLMHAGSTWKQAKLSAGVALTLKRNGVLAPSREITPGRWTTDLTSKTVAYLGLKGP